MPILELTLHPARHSVLLPVTFSSSILLLFFLSLLPAGTLLYTAAQDRERSHGPQSRVAVERGGSHLFSPDCPQPPRSHPLWRLLRARNKTVLPGDHYATP